MSISPAKPDVKVSDLISFNELAQLTGLSWPQARRAADRGDVETVRLPGGGRAVIRSSAEALAEKLRGQK